MKIRRHEIYLIQIQLRSCLDQRPCIVLYDTASSPVEVALLSSAVDMYRAGVDFLIDRSHPCFPKTGLGRTSYVVEGKVREVDIDDLRIKLGSLTDSLASEFDAWAGF